jgi:hypothetical protein
MRNAVGLFWFDRYKAIAEACINIGVSIVLGRWMGIRGILLGTLVSQLAFPVWVEGYVLYKHAFHTSVFAYGRQFALYSACFLVSAGLSITLSDRIAGMGVGAFLLKGLVCMAISGCVYGALCVKNPHFAYAATLIQRFFAKQKSTENKEKASAKR